MQMLKKSMITSMVLSAALLNVSSGSASRVQVATPRNPEVESPRLSEGSGEEVREEFHQSYPLSANGRVSVENLNGGVRITVWDRDEVKVDAIKRAYRRERLNEAKIEVSAAADGIRIKTIYPDWDQNFTDDARGRYNNPAIVDYSITVPRKARLESIDLINGSLDVDGVEGDVKASSVNGRITARGLTGVAKLSTVNGPLEATFTKFDETKPVSLGSVNGNVVLIIPSDSDAILKAGTVHGAITNDFGLYVQHGDYVGHELYGQLGAGGPRINLGNVNGGIAIRHAQDGRKLSSAASLLPEKDKDKTKQSKEDYDDQDQRQMSAEARREAAEARRAARAEQAERAKEASEVQAEVQREVERAMREAQREIERAQREIQRETERQLRERVRQEIRGEGEGAGEGAGEGKGSGKGRSKSTGYKGVTERESKSFPVTGSPRINIITFDGAITVHGWDKAEVSYTATKRGDEQEIKQIAIQTEHQGSAISIIAKAQDGNGAASLDVYVPRNATLHVSSGDGELNLQGVSGDLTLRTGDGEIKVTDGGGQLQVNTGDGEISVANFEGQVEARTGDGAISLDGKFSGLAAQTGDGSISLSVPANSDFTIETNAEGIDNQGLTVSEELAPSKRVRRWKVGRGGNIFVLSTGDGRVTIHQR